jgi:hypothetical protein
LARSPTLIWCRKGQGGKGDKGGGGGIGDALAGAEVRGPLRAHQGPCCKTPDRKFKAGSPLMPQNRGPLSLRLV